MGSPLILREGADDDAPPTAPLKHTPEAERPQERLERLGPRALQDAELLAMILRSGTAGANVLSVATRLVHEAGSLRNLVEWTVEDFRARKGIGNVKALQLVTIMEIARRIREQGKEATPIFTTPAAVFDFFQDIVAGLTVEKSWVLCLNTRHALIRCVELTSGTAKETLLAPGEVLRPALKLGATAIMLVHNHPSGDPEPSRADCHATRRLAEAAKVVGLDFIDHVVLGSPATDRTGTGWFSFKNAGFV